MKRLLFITHRVPYPPDKGERVRAYHEIAALSEHFRVTLAALAHSPADRESAAALGEFCERVLVAPAGGTLGLVRGTVEMLRGRSVTEGYFHSPRMRRMLWREAEHDPFDVVFAYSSGTFPLAEHVSTGVRVMDLVDVDSEKWASYAGASRWPRSWLYRHEGTVVRRLERRALGWADALLLVSEDEARAFGDQANGDGGKVVPVANGVDLEYFRSVTAASADRRGLVFTGTMDYRPNAEGACWFVREVWPELRRTHPDLELRIVGRNPTHAVQALATEPGVTVTGSVRDVRPYLSAAAAAVVPLKIARGIQNKVLEAMAMGLPVIASGPALEGLEVAAGGEVLRADEPAEWVEAVGRTLGDANLRRTLGQAARRCVEDRYSWGARMRPLVSLCRRLVARVPARRGVAPAGADEPSAVEK